MLLVTDWTVTPVGMIDAWVYRALGRDLVQGNASLGEYYDAARPFVLVPRYLLTRVFLEGSAHFLYGVLCATALLLAVLDFLTSVARRGSWVPGVLSFGTCHYLLRSLGWGYVDGSILAWFMVGLAGVARWYRPRAGPLLRWGGALVAGGCFSAMLVTHPMSLPMLLTPLTLIAWQGRRHALPRTTSLGLAAVVLDDTADRFARAQRSFSDVGIDLRETRRAKLQLGERSYWLIFAVAEPRHWLLRAYRVTYHLRLIERGDASAIALVDVGNFAGPSPQVFKAEQIFPANAGPDGTVDRTFEFTIKEEVLLAEFRVFAEGNARLAFRSVEVQPPERVGAASR